MHYVFTFFCWHQSTIQGIGLLVLFSLEHTWSKYTNVACDPVEKLSLILSWDAPCTAISSLIIIVAYGESTSELL